MVSRRDDHPPGAAALPASMTSRPYTPGEQVLLDEIDQRIRGLLAERLRITGTPDRDGLPLLTVSDMRGAAARLLIGRASWDKPGHCCRVCDLTGEGVRYTVEAALAHVLMNHPAVVRAVGRAACLVTLAANPT